MGWLAEAFGSNSSAANTKLHKKFNLLNRSNMLEILPETPTESSLFLRKTCYYFYYTANYYDLYAFFLRKYFKIILLNTLQRIVMLKTYLALYQQSLKTRPQMAKEYHLATVKLAAQLIGGKR